MKTKLLKISMMIAGLIFIFTGASWADSGKNRQRHSGTEKRIESKHPGGSSYNRPVRYRPKIKGHPEHFYRHRPAVRNRWHQFYHRNRWIQKHRPYYRHGRYYSENSYNEFSIAATVSEPGVVFSIGAKSAW